LTQPVRIFAERNCAPLEDLTLPKIRIAGEKNFCQSDLDDEDKPNTRKPQSTQTLPDGKDENVKEQAELASVIL